jgi:hypothetical protein
MKYSTTTFVGGTLTVTAVISNTGTAASPGVSFQFSDLKEHADIVQCTPACQTDEGLGAIYARMPGIPAGGTATYEVEFIPTAVGAAHWSACVYDDKNGGDQVYCGDATTTIR